MPTILWVVFAISIVIIFRVDISRLLKTLSWRIRTGASLKVGVIEIGQSYVSPGANLSDKSGYVETRKDENQARYTQREQYYVPNRNVQLVHKLAPSERPGQLYDMLICLIPHGYGATLASVAWVEYYFGKSRGERIFISRDRARSFSVATSAYIAFTFGLRLKALLR